jgi:hypothetical protein
MGSVEGGGGQFLSIPIDCLSKDSVAESYLLLMTITISSHSPIYIEIFLLVSGSPGIRNFTIP